MQYLKEKFKSDKCKSYRSIPFWSWNDKLTPEGLKKQIRWMNDKGIGGFFMHARSGLQTEYLSEEWMECIEACADEAERLGMKAWAYDENGWPSGFAGGKLLDDEANRDQYILHTIGEYDSEATVSYLLSEEEINRVSEGSAEGEYLNLYIRVAGSTADILNPDVVRKFIELTHERYKARFGEKFSQKIEGFFTDEPQYYRWNTPYTVMIKKYFDEQFGEDIFDSLGLLFVEKKGYRQFRYRYWKGMQHLMLNNFAKQIYDWCEENNMKLTGHYVEETTLAMQMMCCGGAMPFYEFEHIPGIDWLGKASLLIGELSAKQLGSVAAQMGKKHAITETFGCCGWNTSPTDLKRIAGFQYVNGVNMMCHHLIPYTERGNRKYDYPAHYSEVNPWVSEEFLAFNDYFTRLGYLLGEGEQQVNVAMLHPIRSTYFDYKREMEPVGYNVSELDAKTKEALRTLSGRCIDYHFLDETLLEKYGFVDGSKIGCGKCSYDYLVLPTIYTMDKSTEALIRKYVENGGKVLLLDGKPEYLEADEYDYEYLESNCTLDDLVAAQRFAVTDPQTGIFATYRKYGDREFLYVTNASEDASYEQTFVFNDDIRSFEKLDLITLESKRVPLTVSMKPGDDAIYFLSKEEPELEETLQLRELRFDNAPIDWKVNYLPVDMIRYSTDGKNYSKPWPCPALFNKLLKEEYQGKIFFKYEFELKTVPTELRLRVEKSDNDVDMWLNGKKLGESLPVDQFYIGLYDIADMVKEGFNEYVVETNWYEDPMVHYALFGENVTESLRNCIVYDSELQPIQLEGTFGVYPKTGYEQDVCPEFVIGKDFYIDKAPERVTDVTTDGFPFLAGEFTLKCKLHLDTDKTLLFIPGEYHIAEMTVNGVRVGKLVYEKEIDISSVAKVGENDVAVRFVISNRNLMGPHHCTASNYNGVSPWSFELSGRWDEDQSADYHSGYDLIRFYK